MEERKLISPPPHLEFFSFGYQGIISSALWLRSLQDIDYCEVQLKEHLCLGKSWLFNMLDTTSRLAPDFKEVYSYGALALSVIISDVEGAAILFAKGTSVFPSDFRIAYRAGYHALLEEKDKEKAARYFMQAAKIQGKDGTWLYSLATRLYVESGEKEVALKLYEDLQKSDLDSWTLDRMREKLGIKE